MTGDDMTGPWVLALGTLAIGLAALAGELRRQGRERDAHGDDRSDVEGEPQRSDRDAESA